MNYKTFLRLIIPVVLFCMSIATQAQNMMKPSVMVVPSDAWCKQHNYMPTINGKERADYAKALRESTDLIHVISKINIIMADRGFPLGNLETAIKNLQTAEVERQLYTDADGSAVTSDPLDDLYRAAASDIVLQLTWDVNKVGPKQSITFNLQAIDSYTTKQVAGVEGTGQPSFSADVSTLLEEAVLSQLDNFCHRLIEHFQDARENGREISLEMLLGKSAGFNFGTEFDDYELNEVITRLVSSNAQNHSFSKGPATDNTLQYHSVRMPIADADGMPLDAYAFARKLSRPLKKDPYNMTVKVVAKGLGKAVIILGEE